MLQKMFQVTPVYREISEWDEEYGYNMGVYLCLGIKIHQWQPNDFKVQKIENLPEINNKMGGLNTEPIKKPLEFIKHIWQFRDAEAQEGWVILLGSSKHKIKKKAEQAACKLAIDKLV